VTDVVFEATAGLDEELAAQEEAEAATPRVVYIPMLALAWVAAGLLFELLRLGVIWHAPVGGAELVHLSGAWTARVGTPDDRYVPTLFQAITTLFLHWSDSEVPARVLAYLSTATIPFGVFLLRRQLSDAGALLALVLLSLDALALNMGSSASAMGLDLAVTVWLFVALARGGAPWWLWAPIGFATASAGPTMLPLAGAAIGIALVRRTYPGILTLIAGAVGVIAAVILSTLRYGLGLDGLRIAPFQLFADAYSQAWTTASTFDLFLIYAVPIVVAGMVAGGFALYRLLSGDDEAEGSQMRILLLAWAGIALLWLVSSFGSHSTVSIVALSTPSAFLVGPGIVRAVNALVRADWQIARFVVPAVLFLGLFLATIGAGWVHNNDVPGALPIIIIAIIIIGGLGCWWWLRTTPEAAPALWVLPIVIGAFPFVSGALGVAFSGVGELVPSPTSPQQTRQLRDILLADLKQNGGQLVVHPSLWDDLTWPLRDSGTVVVSTRVPATAGAVIWPSDAAKPDGMNPLQGEWDILDAMPPPTGDISDYFQWFTNRGTVVATSEQVSVYVRPNK